MWNSLSEWANALGDRWAGWAIATAFDSTVLLALIGVLWLAVRKRVSPQIGCLLFLLVPLKVLLPVQLTVPAGIAAWTPSIVRFSYWERDNEDHAEATAKADDPRPEIDAKVRRASAVAIERQLRVTRTVSSSAAPRKTVAVESTLPKSSQPTPQSIAAAPAPIASNRPRLRRSALLMLSWSIVVFAVAARFAWMQGRFRSRLRHALDVDESAFPVDFKKLCRQAGVARAVRLVSSDDVEAPAVWGLVWPTIILPQSITTTLSARQLEWVLLHELADVRRRDLPVIVLQRCAAIVHFFNPAVWIANRLTHRLREYACDDFALSLGKSSPVESGEVFVRILRNAYRRQRGVEGALGVFGLDAQASLLHRVRRILDWERPGDRRSDRLALCGLALIALAGLPYLRAAGESAEKDSKTAAASSPTEPAKPAEEAASAQRQKRFELQIVGPDRKPVPEGIVEIRCEPRLAVEQIVEGRFLRRTNYGVFIRSTADGRLVVDRPSMPKQFSVSIVIPAYTPYRAAWDPDQNTESIPSTFTAQLDAGWSVGGIVADSEGKPVKGAKVSPYIEYKKRPGDLRQFGVGARLTTDADGKWRYDSVPAAKGEVFVEINHSTFMPERRSLTRAEFGIPLGGAPAAKIVLNRGLTVSGKVTDEAGKPIAGALVKTKFLNDVRRALTGADGTYRLSGCEPRMARIVVSAKGRATDMQEVRIAPGMRPVDFQMKPGGTVRVQVLDEHGKPIPKSRIFFQEWRGRFQYFEFDHVSQYADNNGIWEWKEAPLDEFKADICRPGGMQLGRQSLVARKEEYVFRPPAALVVSGKVIDAETKQPIKAFRVVPGIRSSKSQMNWAEGLSFTASNGRYQLRNEYDSYAYLVRIEAEDHQPAVSRDIKSNEGNVTIDFELKQGRNIAATVMTPEGTPAANAMVALGVAGSQICLKNGQIDETSTYAARLTTDASGHFQFPPQDGPFQLVITHPSGYAHIKVSPESEKRTINLDPWARVEGTFRVGSNPEPNVTITINTMGLSSYGNGLPHIFPFYEVTTGPGGRFVFERVVPGPATIGRRILLMVNEGATEVTSSCMVHADFAAGKTTHIELGGNGRRVIGKLQAPVGFDKKILWSLALVEAETAGPEPHAASPRFTDSIDRDGSFHIDDMPAGEYTLGIWPQGQKFEPTGRLQLRKHGFRVPGTTGNASAPPVDLGVLTLQAGQGPFQRWNLP